MYAHRVCPECNKPLPNTHPDGLCEPCLLSLGFSKGPKQLGTEITSISGYQLLREMEHGGMGVLWLAQHPTLKRLAVLKFLPPKQALVREYLERFKREAAAAAALNHPNIVTVYEHGEDGGWYFIAMEYVEGNNLFELAKCQLLPFRNAARYLMRIAEAVQTIHDHGILHRDLKPQNIIIRNGEPKLIDFGLAKRLDENSQLTLQAQVVGTASYMPPEQANAKRGSVTKQSDVYSLGAVLYYLLTGRAPFVGENLEAILLQVLENEPLAPRKDNPGVPADLQTICLKCLRKEPRGRYGSAKDLADDLGRWLKHEPIRARPVSPWEMAWKWSMRNPAWAGLIVLTAITLVGLVTANRKIHGALEAETRERQRAQLKTEEAATQKRIAETRRQEAQRASARAIENFQIADEALTNFISRLSNEDFIRRDPDRHRLQALSSVIPTLLRLARLPASEVPDLEAQRGGANYILSFLLDDFGDWTNALSCGRESTNIFGALVSTYQTNLPYRMEFSKTLARVAELQFEKGRFQDALDVQAHCVAVRRSLINDDPEDPGHRFVLANNETTLAIFQMRAGLVSNAESNFREAVEEFSQLSLTFSNSLDYKRAYIISIVQMLDALPLVNARHHSNTNAFLEALGLVESVLKHDAVVGNSVIYAQSEPDRENGSKFIRAGSTDEVFEESMFIFPRLVTKFSDIGTEVAERLNVALDRRADRRLTLDDREGALHDYVVGSLLLEALGERRDQYQSYALAISYLNRAGALDESRRVESLNLATAAVGICRDLQGQRTSLGFRRQVDLTLANAFVNESSARAGQGRLFDAVKAEDEAVKVFESYAPALDRETMDSFAACLDNRGLHKIGLGQPDDAISDMTRSIQIRQKLLHEKEELQLQAHYARSVMSRASALNDLNQYTNAISDYQTADGVLYHLVKEKGISGMAEDYGINLIQMGTAFANAGRLSHAGETYRNGLKILEEIDKRKLSPNADAWIQSARFNITRLSQLAGSEHTDALKERGVQPQK